MNILLVSDIVAPELSGPFDPQPFDGVDLAISCGDLPPEYLTAIRDRLNVPLYYVRGNHDIRYQGAPPVGCMNIHCRRLSFGGLKIMGLEGSRWYNGGPIQYHENQMRRMIWRMVPRLWLTGGVDLVVTHAPPRHVHDAEDPCHRGFKSYLKLIRRFNPRYFIHGHIHTQFADSTQRVTRVGNTDVINAVGFHLLEIHND